MFTLETRKRRHTDTQRKTHTHISISMHRNIPTHSFMHRQQTIKMHRCTQINSPETQVTMFTHSGVEKPSRAGQ